jgi:hypothetical protein
MRSFERLQSLLLVRDFKIERADDLVVLINTDNGKSVLGVRKRENQQKVIPGGKPTLKATFKLDALTPVKQEAPKPKSTVPISTAP